MPHYELEFTPHDDVPSFQPEIVYANPEDNPAAVAGATAKIMDRYMAAIPALSWEIRFLSNQTLGLVYSARKGLLANMQFVRNLGTVNLNHLDALLQMNRAYSEDGPDQEETETFARMYLAFGIMPDIATHEMLPKGYSRRGLLEPPFTLEELYGRIHEVGSHVKSFIGGRINPTQDMLEQPGLLRTYWAFQAMGYMPERNPFVDKPTLSDTIDALRGKFQNPADR